MSMPAFIHILKVGDLTPKKFEGREYSVQEAECVLLNDAGETDCIGVLRFSEKFKNSPPAVGIYRPVFAMVASPKDRRIGAVITDLIAVEPKSAARQSSSPVVAVKV